MKTIKLVGLLFTMVAWINVNAQEVTDYDLQNFARAYKDMVSLNNKAQNEMAKEIEKADLTLESYHAINESKSSEAEFEPDLPKKDFENFDKIQPKIKAIQAELEADVAKAYDKHDLTKQKYTAIAERVKQDYLLQAKMEKILAGLR